MTTTNTAEFDVNTSMILEAATIRIGSWENHGGTYDFVTAPSEYARRMRHLEDAILAFGGDIFDTLDARLS